jgi:hypothetical protein
VGEPRFPLAPGFRRTQARYSVFAAIVSFKMNYAQNLPDQSNSILYLFLPYYGKLARHRCFAAAYLQAGNNRIGDNEGVWVQTTGALEKWNIAKRTRRLDGPQGDTSPFKKEYFIFYEFDTSFSS